MRSARRRRMLIVALLIIELPILGLLILLGWWYYRPNTATVHPALQVEVYPAVADGMHNSNTDLIYWQDAFWLIHASSPWHLGSPECELILWRSEDARAWERITTFDADGNDIRDPTFAPINGRLYLYVMINEGVMATPFATTMTWSEDGRAWAPMREIEPKGWLFWRPKTFDGETWYCPAYWHEHGRSILLKSTDGENWEEVSEIYEGGANDETAIEFLPDGRMLSTARLEVSADSIFGHPGAGTMIGIAEPPYTEWTRTMSKVTRLDGPRLFQYDGAVWAVGRHNPEPRRFPNYPASIVAKKRTALYKVEPDELIYLSSLPSGGDTSYAGVVVREDTAYVSYYTSPIEHDWPWIMGMLLESDILMAQIDLASMAGLAEAD